MRQRAELLRMAAEVVVHTETRTAFLSLAAEYDRMADHAERLAQKESARLTDLSAIAGERSSPRRG